MVYGNGELKYYYDTNDNPPYSFLGKEGYNKISYPDDRQRIYHRQRVVAEGA
jgi:hypothetical protein